MTAKKIILVGNSTRSMIRFRREVILDYIQRGFEVTIATPDRPSLAVELPNCSFVNFSMSRRGLNPLSDIWSFTQLLFLYTRIRPDFIFHYTIKPNIWGSMAAGILRIPSIAVVTGLGFVFIKQSFLTKIVSGLYRIAFFSAKEVWFLNAEDRDEFVNRKILPLKKTKVLPGEGINLVDFSYASDFPDQPTFLLVARMLWDKGVGEFVEAAKYLKAKYPDVKFQLLGPIDDGNPSAISLSTINTWATSGVIEYLGESTDVRPFVNNCTCLVLPSYREGIPRVLLEGSAMGRPLITTDAIGCRNTVVHGKTGYLVPLKDSKELMNSIEHVIHLPKSSLQEIGLAGRKLVEENFSIERVLQHYGSAF